jgi:hypothetical protein
MAIKNYTSGVDVYTSLGEIQGALAAHGARQIMVEYDDQGRPTGVAFAIDTPNGRRGFMLPANIDGVCQVLQRKKVKADLAQADKEGRCVVLPLDDYTWTIRGDIVRGIIKANCRAAKKEAEAALRRDQGKEKEDEHETS